MDGPELIWQQSIKGLSNGTTADGFSTRRWEFWPQFVNVSLDGFRKVLDGTIRILPRKEVIDRSKVVIVNDVTGSDDRTMYHSPIDLFKGLYLMDGDGTGLDQKSWFKQTGRYPAIPTVYELLDDTAKAFKIQIKRSAYASRWPTVAAKQTEMNALFPQEATGSFVAGTPIPVDVTASDADGTVSHIDFYDGATLVHSEWAAPYAWEWTDATAGTHVLKAVAYDNDGNTAQDSVTITVKSGSVGIAASASRERGVHQIYDLQGNRIGEVATEGGLSLQTVVGRLAGRPGIYLARQATREGMVTRKVEVGLR